MTVRRHGTTTALMAVLTCGLVIVVGAGVAAGAAREARHGHDRGDGARRAFGGVLRRGRAVDPAADRDATRSGCARRSCSIPPGWSPGPAGRERSRPASGIPPSTVTDRRPRTSPRPFRPSSKQGSGSVCRADGLFDIDPHATAAAPARRQVRGVLLFMGGFGIPAALYSGLIAELASRGYAVVAFDHPHETFVVEQPDGSLIEQDARATPPPPFQARLLDIEVVLDALERARPESCGRAHPDRDPRALQRRRGGRRGDAGGTGRFAPA